MWEEHLYNGVAAEVAQWQQKGGRCGHCVTLPDLSASAAEFSSWLQKGEDLVKPCDNPEAFCFCGWLENWLWEHKIWQDCVAIPANQKGRTSGIFCLFPSPSSHPVSLIIYLFHYNL